MQQQRLQPAGSLSGLASARAGTGNSTGKLRRQRSTLTNGSTASHLSPPTTCTHRPPRRLRPCTKPRPLGEGSPLLRPEADHDRRLQAAGGLGTAAKPETGNPCARPTPTPRLPVGSSSMPRSRCSLRACCNYQGCSVSARTCWRKYGLVPRRLPACCAVRSDAGAQRQSDCALRVPTSYTAWRPGALRGRRRPYGVETHLRCRPRLEEPGYCYR